MVNVRKRGKGYQYYFEIAPVDGKRKQQVKSGFKTKKEAEEWTAPLRVDTIKKGIYK